MNVKAKATAKSGTPFAKAKIPVKPIPSKPTPIASSTPPPASRPGSKTQACLDLLFRRNGATLDELMAASRWQAHSVRGFLSGTVKKKLGLALSSTRDEGGIRHYRVPGATDQ